MGTKNNFSISELWRHHSDKALRFSIVGISNTLISYLTFLAVLGSLGTAFWAQVIGYTAGLIWSFILNSRWTFKQRNFSHKQLMRFLALQGVLLILSSVAIAVAIDVLSFEPTLSWITIMAGVTIANYLFSHGWVFDSHGSGA